MYYIYKIENLINHKTYIGLTNNIVRRRNRHFTDLRCNRHDNSFLQKEVNIFGLDNFSFEKFLKVILLPMRLEKKKNIISNIMIVIIMATIRMRAEILAQVMVVVI